MINVNVGGMPKAPVKVIASWLYVGPVGWHCFGLVNGGWYEAGLN